MAKAFEKIGEIKETRTLNVSARGDGLCLYLPKEFCELYGIVAGDKIKTRLADHFRNLELIHAEAAKEPKSRDE